MNEDIIIVIAGNRMQFDNFIHSQVSMKNVKFIYPHAQEDLWGIRIRGYIKIGTYYEKSNISEIMRQVEYLMEVSN